MKIVLTNFLVGHIIDKANVLDTFLVISSHKQNILITMDNVSRHNVPFGSGKYALWFSTVSSRLIQRLFLSKH